MPSLLVKNIEVKLLADVNHAASIAEMNQREWVIQALQAALDRPAELMDVRVQHPPRLEPAPIPERPGEHPCPECGVYMVRNEKLRQWECPSCHFIDRKKF
jgi:rubrerythrin